MIIAEGSEIQAPDLPVAVRGAAQCAGVDLAEDLSLEELERRYIGVLLERFEGHRAKVARVLQISERNLYRKIRAYRLEDSGSGGRRPAGRRAAAR